jgi:hypothetical protein
MGIALKSASCNNIVMPGLVPGIHVFDHHRRRKTRMAGPRPAMTRFIV